MRRLDDLHKLKLAKLRGRAGFLTGKACFVDFMGQAGIKVVAIGGCDG